MPNNYLSVLYKHIFQVENENVGLKVCVCGGGGGAQTYHFPPINKVGGGGTCPPCPPASYASDNNNNNNNYYYYNKCPLSNLDVTINEMSFIMYIHVY